LDRNTVIGLTYDLRSHYQMLGYTLEETAEFDSDSTIDAIEESLNILGFKTERIGNVKDLVTSLAEGRRWSMVFNIAEGLLGIGRESQVPAILDAYGIPYTFSDPLVTSICFHKGVAKRFVRDAGFPTTDFEVLDSADEADSVNLGFPLFIKPVAEGTSKGIDASSKVGNLKELKESVAKKIAECRQPVIVETYLPGREFTVGITGTGQSAKIVGVLEILYKDGAEQNGYTLINKERYEEFVEYRLADDDEAMTAADTALKIWRKLGCHDGGRVDLRSDADGIPNFMEVNTLPGLDPKKSDLPILCTKKGIKYLSLIEAIIESAFERTGGGKVNKV